MTEFAQDTVKPNADNRAAPRLLHWLPAAFFLGVVGIGALGALTSPGLREGQPGKDVVTGEWASAWEKNLDAGVPWRGFSVELWGRLNYRLFGEARDGAVVGQGGWLYTAEEFQTAPGDAGEIAAKAEYVQRVRDELAGDGARLVVALVPAKTRVYAAELGPTRVPQVKASDYQRFRQRLEGAGIPTADLHTALLQAKEAGGPDLFFRTDTHWTPAGAGVAARAVAARVRALGLKLPAAEFRAVLAPPAPYPGDLLRYLPGEAGARSGAGPLGDQVRARTTERTGAGGSGLLDDEPIAVTLVGTSYSAGGEANVWDFAGQLQQALGTEVLNVAQPGKGPALPMQEYLRGQERRSTPPQLVIWEIPERFLRVPDPAAP